MPRKLHAHQIGIKYTILNLLIVQTRKTMQNNKMDYNAK